MAKILLQFKAEAMGNFKDYEEAFEAKLVKRYNWSVTDASNFSSEKLQKAYDDHICLEDAFGKLLDQKFDSMSDIIGKPV